MIRFYRLFRYRSVLVQKNSQIFTPPTEKCRDHKSYGQNLEHWKILRTNTIGSSNSPKANRFKINDCTCMRKN